MNIFTLFLFRRMCQNLLISALDAGTRHFWHTSLAKGIDIRKEIKTDKDILDKIENNEIVNVDSISSDDLFKIIKDIEPYKGLDIPNIKETDKIVITPVSCLYGPQDSLIIKTNIPNLMTYCLN